MRKGTFIAALAAALTFTGCSVGPDFIRPEMNVPETFGDKENAAASPEVEKKGVEKDIHSWWEKFQDPQLSQLVLKAIDANPTVQQALETMESARATKRQRFFDFLPRVTGGIDYFKSRNAALARFPGQRAEPFEFDYYQGSFDAAWELDLFGRVRRGYEAAGAQLQAEEASLRDVLISVAAEVARNYLELRGLQQRLEVAKQNEVNQVESFRITNALLEGGQGTELDTSRAESLLETTRATIPILDAQISSSIYALSVLCGKMPNDLKGELAPQKAMPITPAVYKIGSPKELLERRPDIQRAEKQAEVASALVGVALGDLWPKVTFFGEVGVQVAKPGNLNDSDISFYTINPSISWAAFDIGRVLANVDSNEATARAALANYNQVVLSALQEVESLLVMVGSQNQRVNHLAKASAASAKAAGLARERYQAGLVDFLSVLDAERAKLAAEDSLVSSQTELATSTALLYKAIGGGWGYEVTEPAQLMVTNQPSGTQPLT